MRRKIILISICFTVLFLSAGAYFMFSGGGSTSHSSHNESSTMWTCAMHPQIKMPKPGKCPICGMELIPLKEDSEDGTNLASLTLSDRARKLAEVETSPVKREEVHLDIRLYGKLDFDESRVVHITARTSGRIERLFLDYTGISVNKGDHMVELYSPDLITAQQELIQASIAIKETHLDASEFIKKTLQENLERAREKIQLWGLSYEQVKGIEDSGELEEVLTINAPVGGIVIHKDAIEGRYVKEGTKIYTIADLSELWMVLDAYESDLIWLRQGQEVEFIAEAIPGKIFKGIISFIDPVLNEQKRSVRIRANVQNKEKLLKPGMFIRATVKPIIGESGGVISKSLEGKWIGPMHPQIITNESGSCPICGMDLVTAESLGYVSSQSKEGKYPLIIPSTAPLITGKRAVVYIENPDSPGIYTLRQIILGPRAGESYIVYKGLFKGERVVTRGNFKIDSASQILGKPSMMMPGGGAKPMKGHSH